MKWKAWTIGILGLWLALVPFLQWGSEAHRWNDLTVGVIVTIVGFAAARAKPWQGWTAGILGLWAIVAAFVPSLLSGTGLMWNNVIVGLLMAVAGFAALGGGEERMHAQMQGAMHNH